MSQSYNRGLIEDYGRWKEFSAGMWAWIFHKFTGWMLIGYLFTHIAVLSTAIGAAQGETVEVFAEDLPNVEGTGLTEVDIYTATLGGLEGLFIVRLLEVGLLAVAVFHILNGLRLLMIDLGIGLEAQDKSFYASLILTGIITVASVPTFLKGVGF
ncbi:MULTISPECIES: succinate dehydrogenase, cytochrome b556 subunit [Natrialba]|uniref:Succinate dehydrogenase, cytochrome b556 subunit n=1 Tax=Natrialba swarupiae TaxID=2448032 RepID=A0A5D5ATZ3_9EURY|nr:MULTISPECIES: succinate dehydrogenase, cytochrome b556 subunit [Natrialba]MWV39483.1 succinate dehydrogenase, cytochrome b556 subunit [Natrialba sp. INN-245]TYT63040.1 succinate dehydrogenase, cytochrome b556 subunit [Natrialba swarupiae]